MSEPFEIVVAPAEVWFAPVGEAFPAIDAAPAGNWTRIGTAGADNYTEDGVVLRRTVTSQDIRALGSTTPRKVAITETGFEVEFTVMDMNPEEMALAFGADPDEDITDNAGDQEFDIPTSPEPVQKAILVRAAQSPFGDANSQFEISAAIQTGPGEGAFRKDAAFAQRHVWRALKTSGGDFVTVRLGETGS